MRNYLNDKECLVGLSPKVKLSLASLCDEMYSKEKSHTVVIMPFFGLLHAQANEYKPYLNHSELVILDLMKKHFNNVIVYPGENRYLKEYNLNIDIVETLAKEQIVYSRIINKTMPFDITKTARFDFANLKDEVQNNLDKLNQFYSLPYNAEFSINSPMELLEFVKSTNNAIKEQNKNLKICLVCPISYLTDYNKSVYNNLVQEVKKIGGTIYVATKHSFRYIDSIAYKLLHDEQIDERIIHSLEDFAKVYSEEVFEIIKQKLNYAKLISDIKSGKYGVEESEIIKAIEKIDVTYLYNFTSIEENENE